LAIGPYIKHQRSNINHPFRSPQILSWKIGSKNNANWRQICGLHQTSDIKPRTSSIIEPIIGQVVEHDCALNISHLKAFFRYWLPIIIWLALIFIGSTDLMSVEHTSRIIGRFLRWLYPTISLFTILQVHFFLRKLAHVSEYAVLAVLLYRAFVHTALKGRRALSAGLVLLLCAAYAATDEFHQSFVPSRTASLRDVMIDLCGALLAVILYWSIATRRVMPSRS
jgi:VanZ family protein